jgi:hypothetical protein
MQLQEVAMKCTFLVLIALTLMFGVALADGPQMTWGPGAVSGTLPARDDVCQYGFTDTQVGSGWTLSNQQQLGIVCQGPITINRVGFYVEFVAIPGSLDIVISDAGGEISRTAVTPLAGTNEFDVPASYGTGSVCIMLCPTSFNGVTGEDYASPPYGNTYWSNACACTTPFGDDNLTIWAVSSGGTPVEETTWGALRSLFR